MNILINGNRETCWKNREGTKGREENGSDWIEGETAGLLPMLVRPPGTVFRTLSAI